MYEAHFGLRETPFGITPDTGFYFAHAAHQDALNTLLVALRSGEGFLKVTGEVGTGKTLLCRKLLDAIGGEFATAWIPNPFLSPAGLRMALAEELGVSCARNAGQHRLLQLVHERLIALAAEGKRAVLLIDEAQALPDEGLEAVRLLTNLETEKRKLLQVVLFGQPELDDRLRANGIRQLAQRISFSCRIAPLDRAALAAYVQHRLSVAGYAGLPLFTGMALRRLHRASGGTPRLVNILGHKALLAAFGEGARRVRRRHVRLAIADTESVHLKRRPRFVFGALGLSAAIAGWMGWQFFGLGHL